MTIRNATPDDAEELLAIYTPYIEQTAITFEYVAPSVEEFRQRIITFQKTHPYLVAEDESGIIGYSYAHQLKDRAAFMHSAETTIYIRRDYRGKGVGRALYTELEKRLRQQGVIGMYASIAWTDTPNEYLTHNSPEFHAHMGYVKCAHFHRCGFKFDKWFDIIWMEKLS